MRFFEVILVIAILFSLKASGKSISEHKSLSCSENGLLVLFVNGVMNDLDDVERSHLTLRNRVIRIADRLDRRDVETDFAYNTGDRWGRDITQLARQKLTEEKNLSVIEIDRLVSMLIFDRTEFIKSVGIAFFKELIFDWSKTNYQDRLSKIDLDLLVLRINVALVIEKKKVIVVSHSQGNLYVNKAYQILKSEMGLGEILEKNFGNLQVGSVAASKAAKNSMHIRNDDDLALFTLEQAIKKPVLESNFGTNCLGLCHEFRETYLSDTRAYGHKQGKGSVFRALAEVFDDSLEEVAWKLGNNDPACCDGRDGRFYRANYDEPTQDGFIANTVRINESTHLQTSGDTQICGLLSLGDNGTSFLKFENTIINSDKLSTISGDVSVFDSSFHFLKELVGATIRGEQSDVIPLYFERVSISGNPQINGTVILSDVTLYNSSTVSGTPFLVTSEGEYYDHISYLTNTKINGGSLTGVYVVEGRDLLNTTIVGKGLNSSTGDFKFTHILPDQRPEFILQDSYIEGIVYLAGGVDGDSTLIGEVIMNNSTGKPNETGIYFPSGVLYENSSILGSAIVTNGSTFQGHFNARSLRPNGNSGELQNSRVTGTAINGAPFIQNSTITEGNISNFPTIIGSTLHLPTISGDASIKNEDTTGVYYPNGYQSPGHNYLIYSADQNHKSEYVRGMIRTLRRKQAEIREDWQSTFRK